MSLLTEGSKEEVFFAYIKEDIHGQRIVVEDATGREYELHISFSSLFPLNFKEVYLKDFDIINPFLKDRGFDLDKKKLYRSLSNIEHLLAKVKYLEAILKKNNIDY